WIHDTGYGLRATGYGLRATGLQATDCGLRTVGYRLGLGQRWVHQRGASSAAVVAGDFRGTAVQVGDATGRRELDGRLVSAWPIDPAGVEDTLEVTAQPEHC